jgi:hypothetical protein
MPPLNPRESSANMLNITSPPSSQTPTQDSTSDSPLTTTTKVVKKDRLDVNDSPKGSVVPKKGLDSPSSLAADSNGHHHSGRIVPKKGVDEGEERGMQHEALVSSTETTTASVEIPSTMTYNATGESKDNRWALKDGLNRVVADAVTVRPGRPTVQEVPHVADVPKPKTMPKNKVIIFLHRCIFSPVVT